MWPFPLLRLIPVLGRLQDKNGVALEGALLENSQDQALTDSSGLFQGRLQPSIKMLDVLQADGSRCQVELPDERRKRRGVVMLGALACL